MVVAEEKKLSDTFTTSLGSTPVDAVDLSPMKAICAGSLLVPSFYAHSTHLRFTQNLFPAGYWTLFNCFNFWLAYCCFGSQNFGNHCSFIELLHVHMYTYNYISGNSPKILGFLVGRYRMLSWDTVICCESLSPFLV